MRISHWLVTLTLVACTDRPKHEEIPPPAPKCEAEKTIKRADYEAINQTRLQGYARVLAKATEAELTSYLLASFKMLNLFQGDRRACVVEPDGRTSRLVWGEDALAQENAQLDRYSKALFPRIPAATPAPKPASATSLLAFLKSEYALARANGRVHVRFETSDHPENEAEAIKQLDSKIETFVVGALSTNVTNYSSPQAKLAVATELPKLAPVVAYFKRVYGQDLSDVIVVAAPTSTIPHTGGSAYASALGIFIPPVALPIKISLSIPKKIQGTLEVTIDGHLDLITAAMKRQYGSAKLIHLDTDLLSSRSSLAFEAAAAHELRHLLDHFACPQSRSALCDQRQIDADWAAVQTQGREREPDARRDYLADLATRATRAALIALHVKHRPGEEEEGARWADQSLQKIFDANYLPTYPHFFSLKERSGYHEQLAYLKFTGMSEAEAVRTTLATSTGEAISIPMGTVTEKVPWPGRPWLARLFAGLF